MPPTIDTTSYPKATTYPPGHGYAARPSAPTAIVVHSTNNSKTTSFAHEANYLYTSRDVSADFLIGKDGRIVQFLDSRVWQAWHAGGRQVTGGWTAQPEFANPRSIGIELHKSLPDPFYPSVQLAALGWLLQQLVAQFGISPQMIETHGQIAIAGPYIRKHDPDDWSHEDFLVWRDALFVPGAGVYSVRHAQAVFESPEPDGKIALDDTAVLTVGQRVEVDEVAHGGWAHLRSGLGFVPISVLTRIG